jgi:hypothetical protein
VAAKGGVLGIGGSRDAGTLVRRVLLSESSTLNVSTASSEPDEPGVPDRDHATTPYFLATGANAVIWISMIVLSL